MPQAILFQFHMVVGRNDTYNRLTTHSILSGMLPRYRPSSGICNEALRVPAKLPIQTAVGPALRINTFGNTCR